MSDRQSPVVLDGLDGLFSGLRKPAIQERLSLLIYGAPGVGKTALAGTADDDERTSPVLWIDTERGWETVAHRRSPKFIVREMDDFTEGMSSVVRDFRRLHAEGKPIPVKTVVIDSLTEAADRAMRGMLAVPNSARETPDGLAWSEWDSLFNKIRNLVKVFRDLDVHLIMTALEREVKGMTYPSLPGQQLMPKLPAYFNTVARLGVQTIRGEDGRVTGEERRLVLRASEAFVAKDRSDKLGTLPRSLTDPTVTKLLDRIDEGRRLAAERRSNPPANDETKKNKKENIA